jgi:hypothetical protein
MSKVVGGRTFFFIAADMKIGVTATSVVEPVDEPWIAVIGKDNRLLLRKQRVKVIVGEAVGMFRLRLQGHQIENIDNANARANFGCQGACPYS